MFSFISRHDKKHLYKTSCKIGYDDHDDGYDDMLIGARKNDGGGSNAGAAYIVYGDPSPSSARLTNADVKIRGDDAGDVLGYALDGVGDTSGDAIDDIFLGSRTADNTGMSYLFLGPISSGTYDASDADSLYAGEANGDYAGTVAGAGDSNNDGLNDVLIGANLESTNGSDAGAATAGGPAGSSIGKFAAGAGCALPGVGGTVSLALERPLVSRVASVIADR